MPAMLPEIQFIPGTMLNAVDSKVELIFAALISGDQTAEGIAQSTSLPLTTTLRLLCLLAEKGDIITNRDERIQLRRQF
jgi:transcription initiation factor IIE alpha subunit